METIKAVKPDVLSEANENKYRETAEALAAIGLLIPVGVQIMMNVRNIVADIAAGRQYTQIVEHYGLSCKPQSFSTIFKNTVGFSVNDCALKHKQSMHRVRLQAEGFDEEQIRKILEITR